MRVTLSVGQRSIQNKHHWNQHDDHLPWHNFHDDVTDLPWIFPEWHQKILVTPHLGAPHHHEDCCNWTWVGYGNGKESRSKVKNAFWSLHSAWGATKECFGCMKNDNMTLIQVPWQRFVSSCEPRSESETNFKFKNQENFSWKSCLDEY